MGFKGKVTEPRGLAFVSLQLKDPEVTITWSFLETWVMLELLAKSLGRTR